MPPAAAQRLKQRRRVGKTIGLRLHEVDAGLLIGLFRAQQRQIADVAVLPLPLRQIQSYFARHPRRWRRPSSLRRPVPARSTCPPHFETRSAPCCDIVPPPARKPPWRRAPGAAVCRLEKAARSPPRPSPKSPCRTRTTLSSDKRRAAGIGGERDVRQPVRDGDADLRARGVQVRLGLENIRAAAPPVATAGSPAFPPAIANSPARIFPPAPDSEIARPEPPADRAVAPLA